MLKRALAYSFNRPGLGGGGEPRRRLSEYVARCALAAEFFAGRAHGLQRFVVEVEKRAVDIAADLTFACRNQIVVSCAEEGVAHFEFLSYRVFVAPFDDWKIVNHFGFRQGV